MNRALSEAVTLVTAGRLSPEQAAGNLIELFEPSHDAAQERAEIAHDKGERARFRDRAMVIAGAGLRKREAFSDEPPPALSGAVVGGVLGAGAGVAKNLWSRRKGGAGSKKSLLRSTLGGALGGAALGAAAGSASPALEIRNTMRYDYEQGQLRKKRVAGDKL